MTRFHDVAIGPGCGKALPAEARGRTVRGPRLRWSSPRRTRYPGEASAQSAPHHAAKARARAAAWCPSFAVTVFGALQWSACMSDSGGLGRRMAGSGMAITGTSKFRQCQPPGSATGSTARTLRSPTCFVTSTATRWPTRTGRSCGPADFARCLARRTTIRPPSSTITVLRHQVRRNPGERRLRRSVHVLPQTRRPPARPDEVGAHRSEVAIRAGAGERGTAGSAAMVDRRVDQRAHESAKFIDKSPGLSELIGEREWERELWPRSSATLGPRKQSAAGSLTTFSSSFKPTGGVHLQRVSSRSAWRCLASTTLGRARSSMLFSESGWL